MAVIGHDEGTAGDEAVTATIEQGGCRMELLGSNAAYGHERVDVSGRRYVLPVDEHDRPFPLGVGGLLPVVTVRKNGVERVIFAFPAGVTPDEAPTQPSTDATETPVDPAKLPSDPAESSAGATEPSASEEDPAAPVEDADMLAVGAEADGDAVDQDDDAPDADGEGAADVEDPAANAELPATPVAEDADAPADPWGRSPELDELYDAVCLVNDLLDHAGRLSKHEFGYVDGIQMEVPRSGNGFTHVELIPYDEYGDRNPFPVRLCIETSTAPGSPDSLSVMLDYDEGGYPSRAIMTEYARGGSSCRVIASYNEKRDGLVIRKVEASTEKGRRGRLMGTPLYERGSRGEGAGREDRRVWRGESRDRW